MNRLNFWDYSIGESPTEDQRQRGDLLVVQNLPVGLHHNCLEMVEMDNYLRKCMKMLGGSEEHFTLLLDSSRVTAVRQVGTSAWPHLTRLPRTLRCESTFYN